MGKAKPIWDPKPGAFTPEQLQEWVDNTDQVHVALTPDEVAQLLARKTTTFFDKSTDGDGRVYKREYRIQTKWGPAYDKHLQVFERTGRGLLFSLGGALAYQTDPDDEWFQETFTDGRFIDLRNDPVMRRITNADGSQVVSPEEAAWRPPGTKR